MEAHTGEYGSSSFYDHHGEYWGYKLASSLHLKVQKPWLMILQVHGIMSLTSSMLNVNALMKTDVTCC
jgi:hypothetical protein